MFSHKQAMTARETVAARGAVDALHAARDSWYDGSLGSVDARLAAIRNALPAVLRSAQTDDAMMLQANTLRDEQRAIESMRREMVAPQVTARHLPKVSSAGNLTERGRRFIATEVREFLADNEDALDDLDELDTRAEDHAEIKTMQLPVVEARAIVSHFRIAVDWNARNSEIRRPRRQAAAVVTAASVADVPDSMLFG